MSAIKDFIDIYKQGGAACLCVDYLREKYNIGFKGQNKALQATLLASMDKVLPEVKKGAETALKIDFRELQEEIESSLLSYGDKQGKENYCYRLLQPFGLLNDFIRIKIPTGMVKNIEQRIKDLEKEKALQKALSDEEKECYGREIDRCKQEIKDLESNRDEAFTLFQTFPYKEGDFEDCYRAFLHCFKQFTITLDWVLMCNKIDLLELQEQSGIYIISGRCKADYLEIAGSERMAKKIVENFIPKFSFPVELNKPDILADFQKMCDAGYMATKIDGGYIWQKSYPKVLCAYFCKQMCEKYELSTKEYDNGKAINWLPFEAVLNFKKGALSSAVKSWKKEHHLQVFYPNNADKIDELLF